MEPSQKIQAISTSASTPLPPMHGTASLLQSGALNGSTHDRVSRLTVAVLSLADRPYCQRRAAPRKRGKRTAPRALQAGARSAWRWPGDRILQAAEQQQQRRRRSQCRSVGVTEPSEWRVAAQSLSWAEPGQPTVDWGTAVGIDAEMCPFHWERRVSTSTAAEGSRSAEPVRTAFWTDGPRTMLPRKDGAPPGPEPSHLPRRRHGRS